MRFFVGLHQPSDAKNFRECFISINRLRSRKSGFVVNDWILDSGAFSTIAQFGGYPFSVSEYAEQIKRWSANGNLLAAVAQDYMCEPHIIRKTGLSVSDHQRLTIARYDDLLATRPETYIMPVLQGYDADQYVLHLEEYGPRLTHAAWVGVGSVCKRNGDPSAIREVLFAIKLARPDLQLHGFGLKTTALSDGVIRDLLATADSMSWSFAARRQGRNANDWREADFFRRKVSSSEMYQGHLLQSLASANPGGAAR